MTLRIATPSPSSTPTAVAAAVAAAVALALVAACAERPDAGAPPADPLRTVASFSSISDEAERSQALFVEIGRVLQHPRCLNCHPSDAHPRQGETLALHEPPVVRGDDNHGGPAMQCATCHPAANVEPAGVPGHPKWHLAPPEMGWIGLSLNALCEQLKDPERNGGMDLAALQHHMEEDTLVGWGWAPGGDREPAPGTQASFGALFRAWVEAGAVCPEGEDGARAVEAAPIGADCATCHEELAAAG